MTTIRRGIGVIVVGLCLLLFPGGGQAQESSGEGPETVSALLKAQNSKISADLRRIQREIAALRADLDKPDFKDALAGIGYIFGLFGVAAYVASRRKDKRKE